MITSASAAAVLEDLDRERGHLKSVEELRLSGNKDRFEPDSTFRHDSRKRHRLPLATRTACDKLIRPRLVGRKLHRNLRHYDICA